MASFVEGLWQSIFTPGPTPTLLVATNVTFAALQAVLASLLYATHSIHFLILSVLCGGLWAAINWFARELKAHQQQEEADKEKEKEKKRRPPPPPRAASSEDSETEVEAAATSTASLRKVPTVAPAPAAAAKVAAVSTEVEPAEARGELKLRVAEELLPSPSQGQRSGVSTEDEWEKVSENEKDK